MTSRGQPDQFTVWWWDANGGQHEELRLVDAQSAVERAITLAAGAAAKLGMVERIIITDGGDFTNFEWKKGRGVTYPKSRQWLDDPGHVEKQNRESEHARAHPSS